MTWSLVNLCWLHAYLTDVIRYQAHGEVYGPISHTSSLTKITKLCYTAMYVFVFQSMR